MSIMAIPAWNSLGLIPPIDRALPASPHRSPYFVSLLDLVMRFGTSPERRRILRGFVHYRAEIHRLGLRDGFQWLNGSFLEDIETIEQRSPNDIDVVTFLEHSSGVEIKGEDLTLFDQGISKSRFSVDGFFVEVDQLSAVELILWSTYWYSMWSHRRTEIWKGYLQIQLAPDEDAVAENWLSSFENKVDDV